MYFCYKPLFQDCSVREGNGVAVEVDGAKVVDGGCLAVSGEVPYRACSDEDVGIGLVLFAALCVRDDGDGACPYGVVSKGQVDVGNRIDDNIAIQCFFISNQFDMAAVSAGVPQP